MDKYMKSLKIDDESLNCAVMPEVLKKGGGIYLTKDGFKFFKKSQGGSHSYISNAVTDVISNPDSFVNGNLNESARNEVLSRYRQISVCVCGVLSKKYPMETVVFTMRHLAPHQYGLN